MNGRAGYGMETAVEADFDGVPCRSRADGVHKPATLLLTRCRYQNAIP
jgi:hypothetical protein